MSVDQYTEAWLTDVPECFLARFSTRPCDGRLVKAHLLPRQLLRRQGHPDAIDDPRSYVWACGGPCGCSAHHGAFDVARTLRVPRAAIPAGVEELAAELGLLWYLDREYGSLEQAA